MANVLQSYLKSIPPAFYFIGRMTMMVLARSPIFSLLLLPALFISRIIEMTLARYRIFVTIFAVLLVVFMGLLSRVSRLLLQFPVQQFSSLSKPNINENRGYFLENFQGLERSHHELQKTFQKSQTQSMQRLEDSLGASTVRGQQDQFDKPSQAEEIDNTLEAAPQSFKKQLSVSVEFLPLKDIDYSKDKHDHVFHHFMSILKARGLVEGPPELFSFPSTSLSQDRLLCFKGNSTSNGTENYYAFAFRESLPDGASMLPGITLISDTFWDFMNPWHAMYNLLQFVYWRVDNKCATANNLLLFHRGEYRMEMGSWIGSVMKATGLPSSGVLSGGRSDGDEDSVCFETAVVSRSGIGSMKGHMKRRMFTEARCQARRSCNIEVRDYDTYTKGRDGNRQHVSITLMVRSGGRSFLDVAAWEQVVKEQCEAAQNCTWSVINAAQLTFCQQVEAMSHTDILVAAHGAQLTNMIFMPPSGRVMEMFPTGWLELAGNGQFTFKYLAEWLRLRHEGYWRDPSAPPCPKPNDKAFCFLHYKDQPLGINTTYISNWLRQVISSFQNSPLFPPNWSQEQTIDNPSHFGTCECPNSPMKI